MPRISNTNVCAGFFSEQERYKFNKLAIFLGLAILLIHLLLKFNVFEASAKTDFSSESGQFFYGKACSKDLLDSLRVEGSILEPVFFCFLVSNFDSFIGILYGNLGQPLNYLIMAITALAISFMAIKVLSGKAKLDSEFFTLIGKIALIFSLSLSYDSLATLCNFMRSVIMELSGVVDDGINSISIIPTGKFCDAGTAKTPIGEIECMIRGLLVKSGMLLIATFLLWILDIGLGVDLTLKVLALFVTLIFVAVRIMAFYLISFVSICMLLVFLPIFGTMWFFQIGKKPFQTYTNLLITNMLFPVLMIILLSFTFLAVKESWLKTVKLIESFDEFKPVEVVSVNLQNALGGLFGGDDPSNIFEGEEVMNGPASYYFPGDSTGTGNKPACGGVYDKSFYAIAVKQMAPNSPHANLDGTGNKTAAANAEIAARKKKYCDVPVKVTNLKTCKYTFAKVKDTGGLVSIDDRTGAITRKIVDYSEALAKDLNQEVAENPKTEVLLGKAMKNSSACLNGKKPEPSGFLKVYCGQGGSFGQFGGVKGKLEAISKEVAGNPGINICDFSGSPTAIFTPTPRPSGVKPSSLGCATAEKRPTSATTCALKKSSDKEVIKATLIPTIDSINASNKTDEEKKKAIQDAIKNAYGVNGRGTLTNVDFKKYIESCQTVHKDSADLAKNNPGGSKIADAIAQSSNKPDARTNLEYLTKFYECYQKNMQYNQSPNVSPSSIYNTANIAFDCSTFKLDVYFRKMAAESRIIGLWPYSPNDFDCGLTVYASKEKNHIIVVSSTGAIKIPRLIFIDDACIAAEVCAMEEGYLQETRDTNDSNSNTIDTEIVSEEDLKPVFGALVIKLPTNLDQFRELGVRIVVMILIMLVGNHALTNETFTKLFNKDTKIYDAVSENFKAAEKFVNNNPNAQQAASGEKTGLIRRASAKMGLTKTK